MLTFKEFISEGYGRSATHAGRSISQRISNRIAVDDVDHDQEIKDIELAMKLHPSGDKEIEKSQLAKIKYHQKLKAEKHAAENK